jgi:hypothetical protein
MNALNVIGTAVNLAFFVLVLAGNSETCKANSRKSNIS